MTTYVVVGWPTPNLSPIIIQQSNLSYTFAYGLQASQRTLAPLQITDQQLGYSFAFGLPLVPKSLSPGKITIQDFQYKFRFFYPSNGTIPGSPIPRAGQIAPRPI